MKALNRFSLVTFAAATALGITSCGHQDNAGRAGADEAPEVGVTFNPKKGLLVPPETAKFIGLRVDDVEERKIAAAFQFSAQVYRTASDAQFAFLQPGGAPAALASGNINAADAARLTEGQTVSVQHLQGGGVLSARIVALKRGLEKSCGQVEALLAIADSPHPLASGAFVSVIVPLGGDKSVVTVPRSALFRTTEGNFVYTVNGEHFVRTPVKLGVVNHEFAAVSDGLYAGDQIVVQPVMTLWLSELQSLRGGKACADGH